MKKKELLKNKNAVQIASPSLSNETEKHLNFKNETDKDHHVSVRIEEKKQQQEHVQHNQTFDSSDENNQDEAISSTEDSSNSSFQEKHVGFSVNGVEDENSNNTTCRLRRHDTPHYLKGARINNNKQQLAPNEIKEILNRYTNTMKTTQSSSSVSTNGAINTNANENKQEDEENSKNEQFKKNILLTVQIQRNAEKTLGISIVTGNNPNSDEESEESGVFVTKLSPGGLAAKSGICVGDQILTVRF